MNTHASLLVNKSTQRNLVQLLVASCALVKDEQRTGIHVTERDLKVVRLLASAVLHKRFVQNAFWQRVVPQLSTCHVVLLSPLFSCCILLNAPLAEQL